MYFLSILHIFPSFISVFRFNVVQIILNTVKALVRSKNLTAAQNVLSAAQYCAHCRIFKGW